MSDRGFEKTGKHGSQKRSILLVIGGIIKCDKERTINIPTKIRTMLLVLGDAGIFMGKGTGRCHVQGKDRSE